ncbi:hypothetical protein FOL46_007426 [Perkinsus olseni]|uniref:Uncharacterized protein n=1 Tax=Perkinsus olseni TaxID=32597 RepID=A0A7J6LDZ7_PEROL|nr:hypothetical protein FOL46_007426 [Perkinsus olseni]
MGTSTRDVAPSKGDYHDRILGSNIGVPPTVARDMPASSRWVILFVDNAAVELTLIEVSTLAREIGEVIDAFCNIAASYNMKVRTVRVARVASGLSSTGAPSRRTSDETAKEAFNCKGSL